VKEANVLFLSYSDMRFDGRTRELYKVANGIGKTYSVVKFFESENKDNISLYHQNNASIFGFIKQAKAMAASMKQFDILFVDNRIACIPALILKRKYRNMIVIQDARELYISAEQKRLKSKIGCWFETKMLKKADVIICANEYRSKIMKKIYSLVEKPVVYENLRQLEYKNPDGLSKYQQKFSKILKEDSVKIISTSGWSVSRTNDKLIESISAIPYHIEVLLVGGGSQDDRNTIENIVSKNKLKDSVHFIDKVEEDELKYLISQCKIGIVNYGQFDTNNKYCASGKIYEFLFEGIPVVTTSNPPLEDFCNKHGIGEASENYAAGIKKVLDDYGTYKNKVSLFIKKVNVGENNQRLIAELLGRIRKRKNENQTM